MNEYLNKSFVGQYFKASCDVISISMTTLKAHKKNPPEFQFSSIIRKTKSVTSLFIAFFRKLLNV